MNSVPSFGRRVLHAFCGAISAGLALQALVASNAVAQDFPTRRITLIVPYAPGGQGDFIGRLVTQRLADRFGQPLAHAVMNRHLTVIEPAWKMVLANKAILAVLWEMYPDHPNLLPAFMDRRAFAPGTTVVAKPLLGREGANISIATLGADGVPVGDPLVSTPGAYGDDRYVYQALAPVASARDPQGREHHAVIGSWVIDGHSHGIGIREDTSLVTHNRSRFVPHLFGA